MSRSTNVVNLVYKLLLLGHDPVSESGQPLSKNWYCCLVLSEYYRPVQCRIDFEHHNHTVCALTDASETEFR